jgi:DNA-binding transcriptional MocR family regulator
MADPLYYIYANALERKGFQVLAIPEDGEGPRLDALERALAGLGAEGRRRVSCFYVVTVNNPSCTMLSNARRRALAAVAARLSDEVRRPVPVFFDLAYELLLHDPAAPRFASALPGDTAGVVYEIGTLSKLLAPALRVGYLIGPQGPFMDAVAQYTSDVGFSAPLFAQEIAAWLLDHHVEGQLRAVNTGYRAKALAVRAGIERELGPHLAACAGGEAGFYFYLTFKEVQTHTDSAFFRRLTRTSGDAAWDGAAGQPGPRVLTIPGEYCVCPGGTLAAAGRRQLRLSYGYEETGQILAALTLMREAIER